MRSFSNCTCMINARVNALYPPLSCVFVLRPLQTAPTTGRRRQRCVVTGVRSPLFEPRTGTVTASGIPPGP